MSGISDIRYAPPLAPEEASPDTDLVAVYHPSGGLNVERSISFTNLKAAMAGTGGSGANSFFYKADANTTNMSDPGTGKMRWNNANQQEATMLILDWLTTDGFDPVLLFQTFVVGDTFIIQEADFSLNYQVWRKTAPATNGPDYFTVPVEFVSAGGTGTMKHNMIVAILLQISSAAITRLPNLPTSPAGLSSGDLWNNRGVLHIVC